MAQETTFCPAYDTSAPDTTAHEVAAWDCTHIIAPPAEPWFGAGYMTQLVVKEIHHKSWVLMKNLDKKKFNYFWTCPKCFVSFPRFKS